MIWALTRGGGWAYISRVGDSKMEIPDEGWQYERCEILRAPPCPSASLCVCRGFGVSVSDRRRLRLPGGQTEWAGWSVTQDFGDTKLKGIPHLGEDWAKATGSLNEPVFAVANGVVRVARNAGATWNGVIIIDHYAPSGSSFAVPDASSVTAVASMYAHLDPNRIREWVSPGSTVVKGQQIGVIGPAPARSTGPHLHFEIRTDLEIDVGPGYSFNTSGWTDPSRFIDANRAVVTSQPATMISPPNGSTLSGSSVTFQWTTGTAVSEYFLYVGNQPGYNDIYGQSQGTNTSRTVSGIPTDGRTIYVRLWSKIGSSWQYRDYTYTAALIGVTPVPATMISPANGSTLSGSTVTFQWNSGSLIQEYFLTIGNSLGSNDIYGQSQGTNLSRTVTGLPTDGRTLYVRLWSRSGSTWYYRDYTYTASGNKFYIGQYVQVYNTNGLGLNLRSCASTSCSVIVNMPDGTVMQVIGGPSQANGYTWWNLSGYVGGAFRSGWAVQDYLR